MASRYTVYREYVSGRDGDKGFNSLQDAQIDFETAASDSDVARVELIDNSGDEPKVLASK
jgi:hypothetical protein